MHYVIEPLDYCDYEFWLIAEILAAVQWCGADGSYQNNDDEEVVESTVD